ncbi:uncharacterized protein LOC144349578 [Saccoglossus kowalevskii]
MSASNGEYRCPKCKYKFKEKIGYEYHFKYLCVTLSKYNQKISTKDSIKTDTLCDDTSKTVKQPVTTIDVYDKGKQTETNLEMLGNHLNQPQGTTSAHNNRKYSSSHYEVKNHQTVLPEAHVDGRMRQNSEQCNKRNTWSFQTNSFRQNEREYGSSQRWYKQMGKHDRNWWRRRKHDEKTNTAMQSQNYYRKMYDERRDQKTKYHDQRLHNTRWSSSPTMPRLEKQTVSPFQGVHTSQSSTDKSTKWLNDQKYKDNENFEKTRFLDFLNQDPDNCQYGNKEHISAYNESHYETGNVHCSSQWRISPVEINDYDLSKVTLPKLTKITELYSGHKFSGGSGLENDCTWRNNSKTESNVYKKSDEIELSMSSIVAPVVSEPDVPCMVDTNNECKIGPINSVDEGKECNAIEKSDKLSMQNKTELYSTMDSKTGGVLNKKESAATDIDHCEEDREVAEIMTTLMNQDYLKLDLPDEDWKELETMSHESLCDSGIMMEYGKLDLTTDSQASLNEVPSRVDSVSTDLDRLDSALKKSAFVMDRSPIYAADIDCSPSSAGFQDVSREYIDTDSGISADRTPPRLSPVTQSCTTPPNELDDIPSSVQPTVPLPSSPRVVLRLKLKRLKRGTEKYHSYERTNENPMDVNDVVMETANEKCNLFVCPKCDTKMMYEESLVRHTERNNCVRTTTLKQQTARKLRMSRIILSRGIKNRQIRRKSKKTGYLMCEHCSVFQCRSELIMEKHQLQQHNFKCQVCEQKFPFKDVLEDHFEEKHNTPYCELCALEFVKEDQLTEHIWDLQHKRMELAQKVAIAAARGEDYSDIVDQVKQLEHRNKEFDKKEEIKTADTDTELICDEHPFNELNSIENKTIESDDDVCIHNSKRFIVFNDEDMQVYNSVTIKDATQNLCRNKYSECSNFLMRQMDLLMARYANPTKKITSLGNNSNCCCVSKRTKQNQSCKNNKVLHSAEFGGTKNGKKQVPVALKRLFNYLTDKEPAEDIVLDEPIVTRKRRLSKQSDINSKDICDTFSPKVRKPSL